MNKKGIEVGLRGLFYLLMAVATLVLLLYLSRPWISNLTQVFMGLIKIK